MSSEALKTDRAEKAMREAFRRRHAPVPGEEWRRSVMAQVRREPAPADLVLFPSVERLAWRVAAAALVIASCVTIRASICTPRISQLAWDLGSGISPYAWFMASESEDQSQ